VTRGAVIEAAGHRSDVRAVALSSDDASLLSASSAAVKVRDWRNCRNLIAQQTDLRMPPCHLQC
jgi:WD40 repeat protein